MDITVYPDGAAFSSLHADWHSLLGASAANTVFSTPEWQGSWWQTFNLSRSLHLIAFRQAGELLGLAPLMESVEEGHHCLCFIGGLDVTDYFDLLACQGQEAAVFTALLDHLDVTPGWDVVDLHSVREGSPTLTLLPDLARSRGYTVSVRQEEVCPIVPLPATWDGYLAALDKKDRHELRRKLRRLQGEAQWAWRTVRQAADLPQALADFFDLHAKSGVDKAGFWDDARRAFFTANAQAMQAAGWLHLSFLEINNQRVATIYAYDYGDTLGLYNSGYDPAYGYLSVGVLLVALAIQEAIAAGKKHFDFLRGSEPYKYAFGARDTAVYNVVIGRNRGD